MFDTAARPAKTITEGMAPRPAEIALIDRELVRKRASRYAPELYQHLKNPLTMAELHASTNNPESVGTAVTLQARALVEATDNEVDPA